jgi:hypothetical protein
VLAQQDKARAQAGGRNEGPELRRLVAREVEVGADGIDRQAVREGELAVSYRDLTTSPRRPQRQSNSATRVDRYDRSLKEGAGTTRR